MSKRRAQGRSRILGGRPSGHHLAQLVAVGVGLVVLVIVTTVSCSIGFDNGAARAPGPTPSATPVSSPAVVATAAPQPRSAACYRLSYQQTLQPTTAARPVSCNGANTDRTFYVGKLKTFVSGHLLAVDSQQVRHQILAECPRKFAAYVGGSVEARRLSMLNVVWFGPSLAASDAGESWFRCDVIGLARSGQLASLKGHLRGVLNKPGGRRAWGRCASAKPGTAGAEHVLCSINNAWRAVATIDVRPARGGKYPGANAARAAGNACEGRVRRVVADPLSFTWGYEPPDTTQWKAGQHYGFCWAPR